jgi:FecR protein/Putative zinc-finger
MFSNHVTNDLSAYCHGELSNERYREVAEHIISCVKCRLKFEEIKLGVKLAEQLPHLSAPENMWSELESLMGRKERATAASLSAPSGLRLWRPQVALIAASVLMTAVLIGLWFYRTRSNYSPGVFWQVATINGTPRIGSTGIGELGRLRIGQWLETDNNSSARIAVASIGHVEIDPNTRVRLLQTQPTEHRLELARGKMSARIWAPPRLFFVDTPSAVAADIGCAYTLEVDDLGGSLLRVTSGWVALQLKDRESMVPAGAACQTRPGIGPGTPYFEDAAPEFRQALKELDFGNDPATRSAQLDLLLKTSRVRDTLTLWHLLPRVEGKERVQVYERIASFVPPPPSVTREGVLQLNQEMLKKWRNHLEWDWGYSTPIPKQVAETFWKVKNSVEKKTRKLEGK